MKTNMEQREEIKIIGISVETTNENGKAAEDLGNLLLPRALRVPKPIVHDPQMRNLGPDPLGFRVRAGNTFAGSGVFHEAQPVPDQTPA